MITNGCTATNHNSAARSRPDMQSEYAHLLKNIKDFVWLGCASVNRTRLQGQVETTLRDMRNVQGHPGGPLETVRVYGRAAQSFPGLAKKYQDLVKNQEIYLATQIDNQRRMNLVGAIDDSLVGNSHQEQNDVRNIRASDTLHLRAAGTDLNANMLDSESKTVRTQSALTALSNFCPTLTHSLQRLLLSPMHTEFRTKLDRVAQEQNSDQRALLDTVIQTLTDIYTAYDQIFKANRLLSPITRSIADEMLDKYGTESNYDPDKDEDELPLIQYGATPLERAIKAEGRLQSLMRKRVNGPVDSLCTRLEWAVKE